MTVRESCSPRPPGPTPPASAPWRGGAPSSRAATTTSTSPRAPWRTPEWRSPPSSTADPRSGRGTATGFVVHSEARIVSSEGGRGVRAAVISGPAGRLRIACDLIAMSGGQTPSRPSAHARRRRSGVVRRRGPSTRSRRDRTRTAPARVRESRASPPPWLTAGARAWTRWPASVSTAPTAAAPAGDSESPAPLVALPGPRLDPAANPKTAFVDFQNDVTAVRHRSGLARGLPLGRAPQALHHPRDGHRPGQDQQPHRPGADGARPKARRPPRSGVTTFRPPYTPITLGALAGMAVGDHVAPRRRLPLHGSHLAEQAIWQPSGYWSRPRAYPRAGETPGRGGPARSANCSHRRRDRGRLHPGQVRGRGPGRRRRSWNWSARRRSPG